MGDSRAEPSMDDILASIKRIINDEGAAALSATRARVQPAAPPPAAPEPAASEEVLELTQPVAETVAEAPEIVSPATASASRQALASLATVPRPEPAAGGQALEGLVRELLRPMLKSWLDAHLPRLVEELVAREIARITGNAA